MVPRRTVNTLVDQSITILIKSTGEVEIVRDPFTPGFVTSSFDGIEFEIN